MKLQAPGQEGLSPGGGTGVLFLYQGSAVECGFHNL